MRGILRAGGARGGPDCWPGAAQGDRWVHWAGAPTCEHLPGPMPPGFAEPENAALSRAPLQLRVHAAVFLHWSPDQVTGPLRSQHHGPTPASPLHISPLSSSTGPYNGFPTFFLSSQGLCTFCSPSPAFSSRSCVQIFPPEASIVLPPGVPILALLLPEAPGSLFGNSSSHFRFSGYLTRHLLPRQPGGPSRPGLSLFMLRFPHTDRPGTGTDEVLGKCFSNK